MIQSQFLAKHGAMQVQKFLYSPYHILGEFFLTETKPVLLAGAVEYTNWISSEG